MKSVPIYKRGSDGKLRVWSYEVEGSTYRTIAGIHNGALVTSSFRQCKGKQGRSDEQQALAEALSDETGKLDREYRRNEIDLAGVLPSPMLAHKYEDHSEKLKYPVACQPKLDGIRAFVSRHGAVSREWQRHHNVEHILEALAPEFVRDPDLVFDGELYNHDLKEDFGKIASVVRKQNPTEAQRAEARALIQFHVYDLPCDSPFNVRMAALGEIVPRVTSPSIVFVPTDRADTPAELDACYGDYLEAGYEGQMVRMFRGPGYEFDKRSKSLLKRKEFITAEYKLLRIEEGAGNWAGYAKRCVFELADGRECGAGIRGTQGQMKELLVTFQGKTFDETSTPTVTVRHFAPTPDGMPRFPVAIDIHLNGRSD